jgi:hypothetical protein
MVFGPLGYGPVAEGRPVRMRRLPCCGLGLGWCLWVSASVHVLFPCIFWSYTALLTKFISLPQTRFITGFVLAAIPWYIGAFVLICVRVHDQREKPGYVACTIAVSTFLLIQCNTAAYLTSGKTLLADLLWEENTVLAEKTSWKVRIISRMNRACCMKMWKQTVWLIVFAVPIETKKRINVLPVETKKKE